VEMVSILLFNSGDNTPTVDDNGINTALASQVKRGRTDCRERQKLDQPGRALAFNLAGGTPSVGTEK